VPFFDGPLGGAPGMVMALALAVALDAALGDPPGWPHPVRLMGAAIAAYERAVRGRVSSPRGLRAAGAVLGLGLPLVTWLLATGALALADALNPLFGFALAVYLAYTCISLKGLAGAVAAVGARLRSGDLDGARAAVAHIVGRETAGLEAPEIAAAAVESAAENTSDGVIAPLLFLAIGGPALGLAYKAVNTADSMIGYRDARYADLGWAAARLDDLANWVPARLTALFLIAAAALLGHSGMQAWRTARRDARRHDSPNAGWPEAAVAGALGVALGGPATYRGALRMRAELGVGGALPAAEHVARAARLTWLAGGLAALAACAARWVVAWVVSA
jgi:adenosylcobinamide-phosphate synthase